jgi:pimeloyl-ACP methyl ester carboxylesterase
MRVEEVEFPSGGVTCRGDLYLPDGDGPFPAVAFALGWLQVKEMTLPEWATSCAEQGIAALAFDYRRFGLSDGEPRQHIDPRDQIEDVQNCLSYLETRTEVDPNRLGVWGLSWGAAHALIVAATDPRVQCVVSIVPVVDGFEAHRRVHGSKEFRKIRQALVQERRNRFRTGEYGYHAAAGNPAEEFVTTPFEEIKDTFAQIKATVAPRYESTVTYASDENYLAYSIYPYILRITETPTLMVATAGDDTTFIDLQLKAFNDIPTIKKKMLLLDDPRMRVYRTGDTGDAVANEGLAWLTEHLIDGRTADVARPRGIGRLD